MAKREPIPKILNYVRRGNLDGVKSELESGADVNTTDTYGNNLLREAVQKDNLDLVTILIEKGADVSNVRDNGISTLHRVADKNCGDPHKLPADAVKIARMLITAGANIEATNKQGETPLFNAAGTGNIAVLDLLIASGANVNAQSSERLTPLGSAILNQQKEAVGRLLKAGAKVNVYWNGSPLLTWAINNPTGTVDPEIVSDLVAAGANLKAKDKDSLRETALEHAQRANLVEVVTILKTAAGT